MERLIYAEVLDRRGRVRERVPLEDLPFSIGRDYHNRLILDDPYVCARHAQIERSADGGLVLRDLESRNGVICGGQRVSELTLESDSVIRLGRTVLRFRDAEAGVPAALLDGPDRFARLPLRAIALALLGAVAAVTGFGEVRASFRPVDWVDVASAFATQILLLTLWAGMWAVITRVFGDRTRFTAHWIWAACYLVLDEWLGWAGSYARFLFAPIGLLEGVELGAGLALVVALLYGHLTLAGMTQVPRKALLAAATGTALLMANQLNTLVDRPDWVQVLPYWSRLEPLDPGWLPRDAPDAFFRRVEDLRHELDQLAHQPRKEPG